MFRTIYNRLSFMAVSWLDESTLALRLPCLRAPELAIFPHWCSLSRCATGGWLR